MELAGSRYWAEITGKERQHQHNRNISISLDVIHLVHSLLTQVFPPVNSRFKRWFGLTRCWCAVFGMLAASRWWLLWDGIYFWSVVLSGLLAGKRSVPQSVFILVNVSSFANKIPGRLIEVKHQADRKGETYAGGGWYIVTQFSEGEGWENVQNFPQEEGWLVELRLSDSDVTGLTGLPEDRPGQAWK